MKPETVSPPSLTSLVVVARTILLSFAACFIAYLLKELAKSKQNEKYTELEQDFVCSKTYPLRKKVQNFKNIQKKNFNRPIMQNEGSCALEPTQTACWYCGQFLDPANTAFAKSMRGLKRFGRAKLFWRSHRTFAPKDGWTSITPLCRDNINCIYHHYVHFTKSSCGMKRSSSTDFFIPPAPVKPKKARRPEHDRYPTSQSAAQCIVELLQCDGILPLAESTAALNILDICGSNSDNIAACLNVKQSVKKVFCNDINLSLETDFNFDLAQPELFVQHIKEAVGELRLHAVVTSPPYRLVSEALRASLEISPVVAMKLWLSVLEPSESRIRNFHLSCLKRVVVMCRSLTGGEFGPCRRHFTDCWLVWRLAGGVRENGCIISFKAQHVVNTSSSPGEHLSLAFPPSDAKSCAMSARCVEALLRATKSSLDGTVLAKEDGDLLPTLRLHGLNVVVLSEAEDQSVGPASVDWVCLTPPKKASDLAVTFHAALTAARHHRV